MSAGISARQRPEREQRNLRRAIQADGNTYSSQARVGIERETPHLIGSPNVLPGQFGQIQWRKQRESNLTSVRMSGELEVDRKSAGRIGEVGVSTDRIVDARKPETRAIALDGDGLIRQHMNIFGFERARHM